MVRRGLILAMCMIPGIGMICAPGMSQEAMTMTEGAFAKRAKAIVAQDQLRWRLAITAYTFHRYTLFETIDKCVELGVPYLEGLNFQAVSEDIPKMCDPAQLSEEELAAVRKKLDDSGVRMISYFYQNLPADETECRKVFEFAKTLRVEFFLAEPDPAAFGTIEKLCDEYGIRVALHNHDRNASPHYWSPEAMSETLSGRGENLGVCGDMGYWIRDGIRPADAVQAYGKKLFTLQVHDLNPAGEDVVWGKGDGELGSFLETVAQLKTPVVFGVEYSRDWETSTPQVEECIRFFDERSSEVLRAIAVRRIEARRMAARRRTESPGKPFEMHAITMDGKPLDWDSYRGKFVLVDFWATWCGPCIAEAKNILEAYRLFHDRGFEVIGISVDQDREALEAYLAKAEYPWITCWDPALKAATAETTGTGDTEKNGETVRSLMDHYGITAIPTTFLIDPEGVVIETDCRGDALRQRLTELLPDPAL
ncbi:MAG: redoxin family protein [Planctomycetia bacterium]|nr:redoxin family protein [Planctomycetia bacterium]